MLANNAETPASNVILFPVLNDQDKYAYRA
jgi:hypothetical protein